MVEASLLVASAWVTCGPASIAQVTSLRIAATASEAWVVEMEPVPDSIALIIAQISLPRTSPTIWRERLKRKESTSASSRVNSPACRPSGPRSPEPGRASQGWTIRWRSRSSCRCSSYSVSKVPIASSGSISAHSARTSVVLPAPCDAGDDDALACPDRGPQERRRDRSEHLPGDEVVEGDLHQPVAPDHDGRARRHPRRGGETGAAVEAQVQARLRLGEAAGVDLAAGGEEDQEVDQLLVGVRHGRAVDAATRR